MDKAERLAVTLVLAATAALAAASLLSVVRYGVDVFFSDQWMITAPYFRGGGIFGAFTLQHGPPRLGAGSLVTWAGLTLTGWDARADSISAILIGLASCFAALALKRTLFGRVDGLDVVVAAIVLNLVQVEAVALVPIPAHGVLPVFLLLLVCLVFASLSGWLRSGALALLAPLLLFTGFGMVSTPILLALFVGDASIAFRRGGVAAARSALLPIVTVAVALLLFLDGYRVEASEDAPLAEILRFAALMPARFGSVEIGRFGAIALVAGALLLGAMLAVALARFGPAFRADEDARSRTIFLLASFTLLFIALAAFGRASQGAQFGQSSRYMPLMVPGVLALYFAARDAERRSVKLALTTLVVALSAGAILPVPLQHDQSTAVFSDARREWRDCYLATREAERCAERAQMQVWVGPFDEGVRAQLDYLERNRLSLFRSAE